MFRRNFLKALGAVATATLVVNARLVEAPRARWSGDVVLGAPGSSLEIARAGGKTYRYIRAMRRLTAGDIVCLRPNEPFGVAAGNIDKGHYGYVQVGGPAVVRMVV